MYEEVFMLPGYLLKGLRFLFSLFHLSNSPVECIPIPGLGLLEIKIAPRNNKTAPTVSVSALGTAAPPGRMGMRAFRGSCQFSSLEEEGDFDWPRERKMLLDAVEMRQEEEEGEDGEGRSALPLRSGRSTVS